MSLRWGNVLVVARRDYLAVVKRAGFLISAIGLPAYFAAVTYFAAAPEVEGRMKALRELKVVGVVDSSGLFGEASREVTTEVVHDDNPFAKQVRSDFFATQIEFHPDLAAAERALREKRVSQVLVIPPDYLESGRVQRYARNEGLFSSAERPIRAWLVRGLLVGADSLRAERAAAPTRRMESFSLNPRTDRFEVKDDKREIVDFMLPFALAMLLGLAIVTGGQYLLQGLAEEKESRILESLLCAVSPDELLWGKMVGLGTAGFTLVAIWLSIGLSVGGPVIALLRPDPVLIVAGVAYFALGYLLYASLLTAVGAVANNLREATQMSMAFTFMNFVPFILMAKILGEPHGAVAVGLSLFPPTAPTSMMLRLASPGTPVPVWQLGLSLALTALGSWLVLKGASRVFRIGLLMYGKPPNLPEILRWARGAS